MNHWKPEGDFFVGDCMPFCENGTFHLYYLLDQGHHNHPIVGSLGGHQWAHRSSRDLRRWTDHPLALPLDFEAGEGSNCTGSLLDFDGRIYAFYALRSKHFPGEEFRVAVSDDRGLTFRKWDRPELRAHPEHEPDFRDPAVFRDGDGVFHLLLSSSARTRGGGPVRRIGELAHFVTRDLIRYRQLPPVLRQWQVPECSDYFQWGDFYYLFFSTDGATRYRYARQPDGPWLAPQLDLPACPQCRVMKTAPWRGNRRLAVGWVPTWQDDRFHFAGKTVFRELVQAPDGTLGTAWVAETLPAATATGLEAVELQAAGDLKWRSGPDWPTHFRLDGVVRFTPETRQFGFRLSGADGRPGRRIDFDPPGGTVEIDGLNAIRQVDFSRGAIRFRLIRSDDLLDLELDGCRTVITPGPSQPAAALAWFVNAGSVCFDELKLYTDAKESPC